MGDTLTRTHAVPFVSRVPRLTDEDHADEIEVLAYSLWEDAGRPHGRALDHWLAAKELLGYFPGPRPQSD